MDVRCDGCGHPWKLHDRYGCTYSDGQDSNGKFQDCLCPRIPKAANRD